MSRVLPVKENLIKRWLKFRKILANFISTVGQTGRKYVTKNKEIQVIPTSISNMTITRPMKKKISNNREISSMRSEI
jgi:hypothetical protein